MQTRLVKSIMIFYGVLDYDTKELIWAYENGYSLIDTAIVYRNETVIAKSIKDAHLNRTDVIVTSKNTY